jgi:outer membrane protein OmpA-like peptidoglycan-associated protein
MLNTHPRCHLTIEGYTDNTGSTKENMRLSVLRAATVQAYLVSKGVDPNQLSTIGFGAIRPIGDNETAAGRAANRRVEFKLEQP